jgi:hypothetical protein
MWKEQECGNSQESLPFRYLVHAVSEVSRCVDLLSHGLFLSSYMPRQLTCRESKKQHKLLRRGQKQELEIILEPSEKTKLSSVQETSELTGVPMCDYGMMTPGSLRGEKTPR